MRKPVCMTPIPPVERISGEALWRALPQPRLPEPVEARLRRYIVEHALRPGDRLPSGAQFATALGSSRLMVWEALRSLGALGLVEARVVRAGL